MANYPGAPAGTRTRELTVCLAYYTLIVLRTMTRRGEHP